MVVKFLSYLIPNQYYNDISRKSKENMQDAANAFQWHIYEGLCKNYNQEIALINLLPIGSYPQYYSELFVQRSHFTTDYGINNVNIGFCNVKLLRKYLIPQKIKRELFQAFEGVDQGILFVYTVSAVFMEPVYELKKKKPGIKICTIIADLPDMSSLSSNKSILQKKFEEHLANKSYNRISCVDAFVLLTKYMADYMHIDKPFCVMEGIATLSGYNATGGHNKSYEKTILYTGTLHRRFGVVNLLEAFKKINNSDYRLVICGVGDCEAEIIAAAKTDNRIRFLGQLPRTDILELQKKATILVNPRQNNEDFTKYSFPSKTMEYLSSGKPVVVYKLDGIPDEYDDYLFYVEGNSIDALTNKLVEMCEMDEEARSAAGEKGRKFVIEQKNEVIQTAKIKRLMDDICK